VKRASLALANKEGGGEKGFFFEEDSEIFLWRGRGLGNLLRKRLR